MTLHNLTITAGLEVIVFFIFFILYSHMYVLDLMCFHLKNCV